MLSDIRFYMLPLHQSLLAWYSSNARDLPWRHTNDPYRIWVSEIMLQQTQVDTVIPYYEKWLKKFPDLTSLAKASLSDVMKCWAGLGYYRRARMLHRAAKIVMKKFNGQLPNDAHALRGLPGIGRYTAGAIASIAFGEKAAILDGNVIRILTRIFGIRQDIGKPGTIQKLWKISEGLVACVDAAHFPAGNVRHHHSRVPLVCGVGDFNQAMMELGATVCLPENPNCGKCPVSKLCKARLEGKEAEYPVRKKREKLEKIRTAALVLWNEKGKVLLQKQPREGRWGGLWMFPHGKDLEEIMGGFKILDTRSKKSKGDRQSFTACPLLHIKPRKIMSIKHGFTKYLVHLDVYEANLNSNLSSHPAPVRRGACKRVRRSLTRLVGPLFASSSFRWLKPREAGRYPLPSPHQKIAEALNRI